MTTYQWKILLILVRTVLQMAAYGTANGLRKEDIDFLKEVLDRANAQSNWQ